MGRGPVFDTIFQAGNLLNGGIANTQLVTREIEIGRRHRFRKILSVVDVS